MNFREVTTRATETCITLADIGDVADTFPQIFVVDFGKGPSIPLQDLHEHIFHNLPFRLEVPYHLLDQHAVFKDQKVGGKNITVDRPHLLLDPVLDFNDLAARLGQRVFEAGDLARNFVFLNGLLGDDCVLGIQYERLATDDPRRNRYTLQHFHAVTVTLMSVIIYPDLWRANSGEP